MLQDPNSHITIDDNGYLLIDGLKACQVLPGNVLRFQDRNRERKMRRGEPVQIDVLDLVRAIAGWSERR